jgi:hypothetical protein
MGIPSRTLCRAALGAVLLCAVAPLAAVTPAGADLCTAVSGLCASRHLADVAALKRSVGKEGAAFVTEAEAAFSRLPGLHARDAGVAAAAAANLRDGQVSAAAVQGLPGSGRAKGTAPAAQDDSRFGRADQKGALDRGLADVRAQVGAKRGSQGPADSAQRALQDGGLATPGRGSLASDGDAPVYDVSAPNNKDGVTRTTLGRDGTTTVVQTGVNHDGGLFKQVDVFSPGAHQRDLSSAYGDYLHIVTSTRVGGANAGEPLYEHKPLESYDGGGSWVGAEPARGPLEGRGGFRPAGTNIDPDAPARSRYAKALQPACFARPDCDVPLMIRFLNRRPDRQGRPADGPGQSAPRLRTDRYGNVVNPGLEPGARGGAASPGRSQRSYDGGALSNPADQRSGTGSGTGSGGPPKP